MSQHEEECYNLIISTLIYNNVKLTFNIDNCVIYYIPDCIHIHREVWTQKDIIIIYSSNTEEFDFLPLKHKDIDQLGNLFCIGTAEYSCEKALEKQLTYFHNLPLHQAMPLMHIHKIDPIRLKKLYDLQMFW